MSLAIDLIKKHEGFRGVVYEDTEGFATIGYGTKLPLDERDGEALLKCRLNEYIPELRILVPNYDAHSEVRRAVLQDMIYNLGFTRLKSFKKMLNALKYFNYDAAANEMLDSRWAKQVKGRAIRLAKMMRTGETDSPPNPL